MMNRRGINRIEDLCIELEPAIQLEFRYFKRGPKGQVNYPEVEKIEGQPNFRCVY